VAARTSTRRIIAAVLLGLAMAGAPAGAVASFSGTGSASPLYSAASLPAPAAAATTITIGCVRHGNDVTATIIVTAYGTVPKANYHQITITPPSGAPDTADLAQTPGRTFTYNINRRDGAEWTYQVQGQYKVQGTTNIWYGSPLTGTLACS
jgi:hypothetical protein